jgi:hypothetical protein
MAGGQFTFTTAIWKAIDAQVVTLSGGQWSPGTGATPSCPSEITTFVAARNMLASPSFAGAVRALRSTLATSSEPCASGLLAMIGPDNEASLAAGTANVQKLWSAFKAPGSSLPALTGVTTLNHLRGVRAWEVFNCWSTAQLIGKKFTAAIATRTTPLPRTPGTKMPNTTVMTSVTKSNRATDEADLAAGRTVRGDEVVYGSNLPAVVQKMIDALADGWVLHARVISGVWLDLAGSGTPNEEHSLLLYRAEYTASTAPEFFAFDPDLNSNVQLPATGGGATPQRAFQSLYFDRAANRLSTAKTNADFPVKDRAGHHANGSHRYQLVRVFSVDDA